MFEEVKTRKASLGFRWIRSEIGNTYLCRASDYAEMRNASDAELSASCIDESLNPHND
jgi:hypothetical protein